MSVPLYSLDPRGKPTPYDAIYKPIRRGYTRVVSRQCCLVRHLVADHRYWQELRKIAMTPSFKTLPWDFVPLKGRHWYPPLFQYGWRIDHATVCAWAKENGPPERWAPLPPFDDIEREPPSYDPEVADPEDPDQYVPYRSLIEDVHWILLHMAFECGVDRQPEDVIVDTVMGDGEWFTMFRLFDNYHLKDAPPYHKIHEIMKLWGRGDEPRWYADAERGKFVWCYSSEPA